MQNMGHCCIEHIGVEIGVEVGAGAVTGAAIGIEIEIGKPVNEDDE